MPYSSLFTRGFCTVLLATIMCPHMMEARGDDADTDPPRTPILDNERLGSDPLDLSLAGIPSEQIPKTDPISIKSRLPGVSFQISYMADMLRYKTPTYYFILKKAGEAGQAISIKSYVSAGSSEFGHPQLSPDGKTLLFHAAGPAMLYYRYAPYDVGLWDLAGSRIDVPPIRATYLDMRWSPDSRYLGYYLGGDKEGGWEESPRLCAYNLKEKKEKVVTTLDGFTTWAFTTSGSVLVSRFESKRETERWKDSSSIWEYNLNTEKSSLLIPNALRPSPSPNNRWVAFMDRPTLPKGKEVKDPYQASFNLWVYDRRTGKRTALGMPLEWNSQSDAPQLLWTHDSKSLLVVFFRMKERDGKQVRECLIRRLDVERALQMPDPSPVNIARWWRFLAAVPVMSTPYPLYFPYAQAKVVTKNNRFLILKVRAEPSPKSAEQTKPIVPPITESFVAIDVQNGDVQTVALNRGNRTMGWDWTETSNDQFQTKTG